MPRFTGKSEEFCINKFPGMAHNVWVQAYLRVKRVTSANRFSKARCPAESFGGGGGALGAKVPAGPGVTSGKMRSEPSLPNPRKLFSSNMKIYEEPPVLLPPVFLSDTLQIHACVDGRLD